VYEWFVREWCKQNERLDSAPISKWAFRGKQSVFSVIGNELCAYVMDFRKSGYMVSTEKLQLETSKIA
jgi:hypothetical protein